MRLTFSEIKNKIRKIIPEGIDYDVDLEAGSISVITKEPASFGGAGGQSLTVKIAKAVRRRVVIRPHPDLLSSENEVNDAVSRIMPEEALIRRIWLDPALSEVTIEADDPKSAVGQKGTNIQQLRNEIGWLLNVVRAPARESTTQTDIRRFRKELADERKTLLRKFGTRILPAQQMGHHPQLCSAADRQKFGQTLYQP